MLGIFDGKQKNEDFWTWLSANAERIQGVSPKESPWGIDEISARFKQCFPDLVWEISRSKSGPWVFCVSADGDRALFTQVKRAVHEAPIMTHWIVKGFRQRGATEVKLNMRGRTLGYEDIWCGVVEWRRGVFVTLCIRGLNDENTDALGHGALILLDNAVGEYDATMKITGLGREPLPEYPERSAIFFPLSELPQYLDEKVRGE